MKGCCVRVRVGGVRDLGIELGLAIRKWYNQFSNWWLLISKVPGWNKSYFFPGRWILHSWLLLSVLVEALGDLERYLGGRLHSSRSRICCAGSFLHRHALYRQGFREKIDLISLRLSVPLIPVLEGSIGFGFLLSCFPSPESRPRHLCDSLRLYNELLWLPLSLYLAEWEPKWLDWWGI